MVICNFIWLLSFIIGTQEIQRLQSEPVEGIEAKPFEDNLRYFDVTLEGPSESPYKGMCAFL